MEKSLFHQHLLIKAYVNNPPKKMKALNTWLTELVLDINMKVVIPARSKYVDAIGNRGLTGNIGIETSHVAIHVWDEPTPAFIQMDVYSCSCFETSTVLNKLKEFDLINYEYMLIDRNEGFVVKEHISTIPVENDKKCLRKIVKEFFKKLFSKKEAV